jgi:hypothetical protein
MGKTLEGKTRESYRRNELRDHDEAQALKILKRGLGVLGIKKSDLEGKAKGALEKQVLAWWLREKTVVAGNGLVRNWEWVIYRESPVR